MALTAEWYKRIDQWRQALEQRIYTPLGDLDLQLHVTPTPPRLEEARTLDYQPMPIGTVWGGKWDYGWIKTSITVPPEAAGQRVVFRFDSWAECEVFVEGEHRGSFDHAHPYVTLAKQAEPGRVFDIMMLAYAGHGLRNAMGGPIRWGTESVPEPPEKQSTLQVADFGVWNESAFQLWMDVQTLWWLRESLADRRSLRLAEIDAGLRDFAAIVDLELPPEAFDRTVAEARERLKPLLACRNGSTTPEFYAFGHAHIDTAWLWPLQDTEHKCERTFGNQLALMEEYPEYKFLCSQPHQYRWIQRNNPVMYQRIKDAAARGQWIPEGAMWIEPDTNITSGESLIRQFIHGKKFFMDEFGVDSRLMWLPDVFGYCGQMPQIMRGCEVDYFSTQKIFWLYHEGSDPFPYNTFTWVGIDGTGVLTHIHNEYNAQTRPDKIIERWAERRQDDLQTRLYPFGWGDGGGGATREHLEYLRRQVDLEGVPKMRITHPNDFFKDLEQRGYPDDRYVGELYYQCHRGTYTAQAKTKLGNRRSEFALREAECWLVAAAALRGLDIPGAQLDELWKVVMLNQFHDILPGSSIQRVYEEAEADYATVLDEVGAITERATGALVRAPGSDPGSNPGRVVFNSLGWRRRAWVELPAARGYVDAQGRALPTQAVASDRALVEVQAPSCGWTTVQPVNESGEVTAGVSAGDHTLENDLLRVTFDDRGRIESLYDKRDDRELAVGPCNEMRMYKDVPVAYDAWDIDPTYKATPVVLDAPAEIEVHRAGPVEASLVIRRTLHESTMTQTVTLRRDSRRVEFHTVIDWHEKHKLLKVAFPVDYLSDTAVHEIQFGHLRRPTHASRPYDRDQFEVPQQKWSALVEEGRGFAVLNDCKYGLDVTGHSLNLTLLRAPVAPDMHADRGRQEFTYAVTFWHGPMVESDVVRESYELNAPVVVAEGEADERALFSVDAANVIIETIKPAEDGSGDVVVRLYESMRTATRCTLSTGLNFRAAAITNMLECDPRKVQINDGRIDLELRPFEVKTLRLTV